MDLCCIMSTHHTYIVKVDENAFDSMCFKCFGQDIKQGISVREILFSLMGY